MRALSRGGDWWGAAGLFSRAVERGAGATCKRPRTPTWATSPSVQTTFFPVQTQNVDTATGREASSRRLTLTNLSGPRTRGTTDTLRTQQSADTETASARRRRATSCGARACQRASSLGRAAERGPL